MLQQFLRLGHSSVPLVLADLPSLLSGLQTVVGLVVFFLSRSVVLFSLGLLAVGAYFPAGTIRLTGCDIVAVADVVPGGQQEVPSAVVTEAWRISFGKAAVKPYLKNFDLK